MILSGTNCSSAVGSHNSLASRIGTSMHAVRSATQLLRDPVFRSFTSAIVVPRSRGFAVARAKNPAAEGRDAKNDVAAAKAKALEVAMKEINSKYGSGTVMKLGERAQEAAPTIPTGALTLDMALGGGYPQGKITEIFGLESSGKSTLALHAIAQAQKKGGMAVLVDAECALDKSYARKLGVDVDAMLLVQPNCGEDALNSMERLILSSAVDLICVDSVAALVPRSELEGDVGSPQMGTHARLMSQGLRKITSMCANTNTSVIFLNQIRHKIIPFGNPEVTTGGMALAFYASVRMRIGRGKGGTLLDAKGDEVGIRVLVKVVKNKCAPPKKEAEFDILWSSGISAVGCLLDAAEKVGVVTRKGSWYSYADSNLAQGRDKAVALLKQDTELYSKIEAETRAKFDDPSGEAAAGSFDAAGSLDEDEEFLEEVAMGN